MARPRKATYCACGEMTVTKAGRRHHVCFRPKQKGGRPKSERCLCGEMTAERAAKEQHYCVITLEQLRARVERMLDEEMA